MTLAVPDHNVPTTERKFGIKDHESKVQVEKLIENCKEFRIPYFSIEDLRQEIVHIIGPEQGFTYLVLLLFAVILILLLMVLLDPLLLVLELQKLNMFYQLKL